MKPPLCCVAVVLAFCVFEGRSASEPPRPPQQGTPWTPRGTVPTNILSAAEALFAQGFPDPRGCEYREIEVEVSGFWQGKSSTVKTRGWVLPESSSATNRFAICWNGVIYPITKM